MNSAEPNQGTEAPFMLSGESDGSPVATITEEVRFSEQPAPRDAEGQTVFL